MKTNAMFGNKIIYQKMHRKQRTRHLFRLQEIKNRPSPVKQEATFFRQSVMTAADSEKNLQIERNNIALFNRIASIIKERPKMQFPKSRSHVKSLDQAMASRQRKQLQLKAKYEQYMKRINEQAPTIKNQVIYKDRAKHERYLKFIGKYPFHPHRRIQTEFQVNFDERQSEIFHQKSLDFDINIQRDPKKDAFVISVKDLLDSKEYKLGMQAEKFKASLEECNMSYEQLVGRLRMAKNGEMQYVAPEVVAEEIATIK